MIKIETEGLKIIALNFHQLLSYVEPNKLEAELALTVNGRIVPEKIKRKIVEGILPEIKDEKSDNVFYTFWIIIEKSGNEIAAEFCYKGRPENGVVEIGYATFPQFQNRGIMSLAITEIINWTFSNTDIKGITAVTDVKNHASIKVLKKTLFSLLKSDPENLIWFRKRE